MAQKVESYASKDGRLFHTEQEADLADIEQVLRASDKPRLTSSIGIILEYGPYLAEVLAPLAPKGPMPGNEGSHADPRHRPTPIPVDTSASYRPGGCNEPRAAA